MNRIIGKVLLATIAIPTLTASAVLATSPDPLFNSSVDPVLIGGTTANVPFVVVLRDSLNVPIPGSIITINFSSASGVSGISAPVAPYTAQIAPTFVDCQTKTLSQVTDASGTVTFYPLFGGAENNATIEIRADGILLTEVPARSTDMNANGVSDLFDLNTWTIAWYTNPYPTEADWDNDGTDSLLDIFIFSNGGFFGGGLHTVCP